MTEKFTEKITEINTQEYTKKYDSEKPEQLPALTLAYIGDAYYELVVRNFLLRRGIRKVEELHRTAITLVRAGMQARLAHALESELDEQERTVLHRGRNTKGLHNPKGATVQEYRAATGLEALVGFWYLRGDEERLERCFAVLYEIWEGDRKCLK